MRRILLACPVLLMAAAPAPPHPVDWWIMHDAQRDAEVATCDVHNLKTAADLECNNALRARNFMAAADAKLMKERNDVAGIGSNRSPAFWDQNAIARKSELRECEHPSSILLAPSAAVCRAARISEARNR